MLCNGRWIFNSLVGRLFFQEPNHVFTSSFYGFFSVDGNGIYNDKLFSIVLTHFHGRITIEGRATAVTSIGSVVLV